jgi:azurin
VQEVEVSSVGDSMAFDTTTLTLQAGHSVHLVFHNKAKMEMMTHDWFLAKQGTCDAVALAGFQKGEKAGYMDVSNKNLVAWTPVAHPGQTVETTFDAPEPGTWCAACSINGHWMAMKQTVVVK